MSISILEALRTTSLLAQAIHAATHPIADPVVSPRTEAAQSIGPVAIALVMLWTFFAVSSLLRLRVFRSASVVGPRRLDNRHEVGAAIVSFAAGLLAWLLLQMAYESYLVVELKRHGVSDAERHLQEFLKPHDLAILSTVPPMLGLAVMLIMLRTFAPGLIGRLGLRLRSLGRGTAIGVLGFVVIFPIVFWAGDLLENVYQHYGYKHPAEHEMLKDLGQTTRSGVAAILVIGATLCAPLFEEVLFRGHLQTLLRQFFVWCSTMRAPTAIQPLDGKPWHSWMAIVVTAALFAVVHPPWMAPLIFILALGLGYVYERTGILWASITVHLLFNSVETIQYYFLFMRGH